MSPTRRSTRRPSGGSPATPTSASWPCPPRGAAPRARSCATRRSATGRSYVGADDITRIFSKGIGAVRGAIPAIFRPSQAPVAEVREATTDDLVAVARIQAAEAARRTASAWAEEPRGRRRPSATARRCGAVAGLRRRLRARLDDWIASIATDIARDRRGQAAPRPGRVDRGQCDRGRGDARDVHPHGRPDRHRGRGRGGDRVPQPEAARRAVRRGGDGRADRRGPGTAWTLRSARRSPRSGSGSTPWPGPGGPGGARRGPARGGRRVARVAGGGARRTRSRCSAEAAMPPMRRRRPSRGPPSGRARTRRRDPMSVAEPPAPIAASLPALPDWAGPSSVTAASAVPRAARRRDRGRRDAGSADRRRRGCPSRDRRPARASPPSRTCSRSSAARASASRACSMRSPGVRKRRVRPPPDDGPSGRLGPALEPRRPGRPARLARRGGWGGPRP